MWLLVYRVLPDAPSANMNAVWGMVLDAYAELSVDSQFGNLLLNLFTNPDKHNDHYPKLKGKANEIKHLVEPLLRVWIMCCDDENDMHKAVTIVLKHLVAIINLMDEHAHDAFMSVDNAKKLRTRIDDFLIAYTALCTFADAAGHHLWNVTPKFHWLWHLGVRAYWLSPRRSACWLDETFVGVVKRIAAKSTRGCALHKVPRAVMTKYRWGRHADHRF